MAATITIAAGARSAVLNISDTNQARIITAIERAGYPRAPDGEELDDFDYFKRYLIDQYRGLVYRTERKAAAAGVGLDTGLVTE